MPPLVEISANKRQRCPGRTVKLLSERTRSDFKPVHRVERTYSYEKRLEVLQFLQNYWLLDDMPRKGGRQRSNNFTIDKPGYRLPTFLEAAKFFKIPVTTIQAWWKQRDLTVTKQTGHRYSPWWPDLEAELYEAFLTRRKRNEAVTTAWFRRESKDRFRRLYPTQEKLFVFSAGWFTRFQQRHQISRRRITKKATKLPKEIIESTSSFLRFIKRVTQSVEEVPKWEPTIYNLTHSPKRRFPPSNIINLDETPIPFEFNSGYTYDTKGSKSVQTKSDRSGWDKRQATLIVYIWADGIQRIKPKLIFHGVNGPTNRIYNQEKHLYSPEVTVEYNPTAYNNEELFLKWLEEEYTPVTTEIGEVLLVMDVAAFHKTPAIKAKIRELKTTLALIPAGMTSLLQPCDTAVNSPLKQWLQEFTDEYVVEWEVKNPGKKWTVSDRRIMTTWTVAKAINCLAEKKELVQRAFIQTGISIRPDGSQNSQIRIKGIANTELDWNGWETTGITIVAESHQELPVTPLEEVGEFGDSEEPDALN